jgi:hypothetical protein
VKIKNIHSSADYLKLVFEDNGVLKKPCTESGILEGLSIGASGVERPYPQRRPTIRDEFDGSRQLLPRPPPESILEQYRGLPHLPTNLVVQVQDLILNRVNDRLLQCAFDLPAKYQLPIPICSRMRLVERPEYREWTEWVCFLKHFALKRRISARILYNGQVK